METISRRRSEDERQFETELDHGRARVPFQARRNIKLGEHLHLTIPLEFQRIVAVDLLQCRNLHCC
jgi:hypothetical protein